MKTYSVEEIRVAILDYRLKHDLNITEFTRLTWVARQTQWLINNGELAYIMPATLKKLRKHKVIE